MNSTQLTRIVLSVLILFSLIFAGYADDSSGATLRIVNSAPVITAHSLSSKYVINGTNVTMTLSAADDFGISKKVAIITRPDGSKAVVSLPGNYTANKTGKHNVLFVVNDTDNVNASTADYFNVGRKYSANISIVQANLSKVTSNLTIYFENNVIYHNKTKGTFRDLNIPALIYDIFFKINDSKFSVMLRDVNLSLNTGNSAFGIDRLASPYSGQLVTYGINNTYTIRNATITISYSGLSYTDEDNLEMVKCANWNFKNETCAGSFSAYTSVQNQTGNFMTAYVTGFSAYGIRETSTGSAVTTIISGGGHGHGITDIVSEEEQLEAIPGIEIKGKKIPSRVLLAPESEKPFFSPGELLKAIPILKSIAIVLILTVSFLLGFWINKRTTHVSGKEGELIIKNNMWPFNREMTQIFVSSETDKIPEEIFFGNSRIALKEFKGGIKNFFKDAMNSGPIAIRYKKKVIFTVKNNENKFIDLFKGEEVKVKGEGISRSNSDVYYIKKRHNFDAELEEKLWEMLEPKGESDVNVYFKRLLKDVAKANLRTADDLRDYVRNITKILQ